MNHSSNYHIDQAERHASTAERYSSEHTGIIHAMLALAQIAISIDARLGELVELERERLTVAVKEPERPYNAMGGGSAGLDTADDFAMHCSKPDRHGGLHSYEEDSGPTPQSIADTLARVVAALKEALNPASKVPRPALQAALADGQALLEVLRGEGGDDGQG